MPIQLDGTTGISTTGNIIADGSLTVGTFAPLSLSMSGNVTAGNVNTAGIVSATGNITGGNIATAGQISATGNITAGNATINGDLTVTGNASLAGNIVADRIVNGTTEIAVQTANGNANVTVGGVSNVAVFTTTGITVSGTVSASANVTGGNLVTGGLASVTGNITGGNIVTAGLITATGNVSSGNLITAGAADVTGNVTGGNIVTGGLVTATGNITSTANVAGGNLVTAGLITASGNVTGGNLTTGGLITATGNITSSANVAGGNLITAGLITATGDITSAANVTGANVNTGGVVSATGNITGGNLVTAGLATVTGNVTAGNVVTGGLVSATGNLSAGNVNTGGMVSATGNVTGGNLNVTGLVSAPTVTNTGGALVVSSASNGNINLSPNGTGNVVVNSTYINGVADPVQSQDVATKIYVDNLASTALVYHEGVVAATTANLATTTGGTITYNQPNGAGNGIGATITTTGTFDLIDTANVQTANTRILVKNEGNAVLNGIYVWSNATVITRSIDADEYGVGAGNLSLNDYFFVSSGNVNKGSAYVLDSPTGTITFGTSNISFAQFSSSQVYSAGTGLTLTGTTFSVNASQTQVTAVGTLGSLSVTGNTTSGNLLTGGLVSATGNVSGGNVTTGGQVSATANVTGGNLITGGLISATGNVTGGNLITGGLISATGNITGGNILGGANVNATTHTGATVSVTGNITGANVIINGTAAAGSGVLIVSGNIQTSAANATANIGNVTNYFNVVHGRSTTAQYADLAELYISDAVYQPGTVLDFGGINEVTISVQSNSSRIAGVVSTNPAHLMNGMIQHETAVPVALTGRVPTSVVGNVVKGDMMVSAGNGQAQACATPAIGTVIGKALENFSGESGVIEIVVGRI